MGSSLDPINYHTANFCYDVLGNFRRSGAGGWRGVVTFSRNSRSQDDDVTGRSRSVLLRKNGEVLFVH